MNPHHFEHLKSCTKKHQELTRGWKCHCGKTELQKSSMFLTDTVFKITYFFHQLCTLFFVFCLSLRKRDMEHFLVTDIIGINIHFRGQGHIR
jgi:hypothetical protein